MTVAASKRQQADACGMRSVSYPITIHVSAGARPSPDTSDMVSVKTRGSSRVLLRGQLQRAVARDQRHSTARCISLRQYPVHWSLLGCRSLTLSALEALWQARNSKQSTVATCFYGTIRTTSTMGHSPELGDGPIGHPGA